jgi:F-type H+-transporting ATPase subunit b
MRIDWWTLALQAVNFLVLFWILSHFLFKPVSAMIVARQAATTKLLDEARSARQAADAERDKASAEAAHLTETRTQMLTATNVEAQAEKGAVLAQAKMDAAELLAGAQAEIERTRTQQAAETADRASRLAIDIAAKVLARLPRDTQIAGFIDGVVAGIEALPEATLAELGADGAPLHLKAARPLTDAEATACRAALARAVGRPIEFIVEPDPRLIAGIEIEARHARVRNSLRADLDRLTSELTRHDQPG